MKIDDKDLWLKALKDKLEDHSEAVPVGGWDRLNKSLNASAPKKVIPFRRWAYIGVAASITLLLGVGSWFLVNTIPETDITNITQKAITESTPNVLPSAPEPLESTDLIPFVEETAVLAKVVTSDSKTGSLNSLSEEPKTIQIVLEEKGVLDEQTSVVDNDKDDVDSTNSNVVELYSESNIKPFTEKEKRSESTTKTQSRQRSSSDKLHIPISSSAKQNKSWSMGLAAGSAGLMANNTGPSVNGISPLSTILMSEDEVRSLENGMAATMDQKLVMIKGKAYRMSDEALEYKHNQPITFGVSVRKYFTDRLSLSTGITYTLLSSDIKVQGDNENAELSQKFHYLGIPVHVNYDFYKHKVFQLYASVGGSVERAVYGKQGSKKVTNNRMQFAVSGGVGAQINLSKHVGFYIEPGVAYYFKDGSDFETIRSDRPFNFDINAGLRLSY